MVFMKQIQPCFHIQLEFDVTTTSTNIFFSFRKKQSNQEWTHAVQVSETSEMQTKMIYMAHPPMTNKIIELLPSVSVWTLPR